MRIRSELGDGEDILPSPRPVLGGHGRAVVSWGCPGEDSCRNVSKGDSRGPHRLLSCCEPSVDISFPPNIFTLGTYGASAGPSDV